MNINRQSRLSRNAEKKEERNIALTVVGIIVIVIALAKYGLPAMINAALFVGGSRNSQNTPTKNKAPLFLAPPVIDVLPNATNSAQIAIHGTTKSSTVVNLYDNDTLIDKVKAGQDGKFSFTDFTLTKGDNVIKAKASDSSSDSESDFSNEQTITFLNSKPNLSVDTPSDNQSFSKDSNKATVSGKTDAGNKVTVNDFWAIVDVNGKFSYDIPLQNGDNKIKVVVTDPAGNNMEIDRKVTYSP